MKINIISLFDLLDTYDEKEVEIKLSTFLCVKNLSVQNFLHKNSIPYEKSGTARTFLLVNEQKSIIGYYSLALNTISIGDSQLSHSMEHKIRGVGNSFADHIPGFLIGQLARHDECEKADLDGSNILNYAIDQLTEIHNKIGGRFILIHCIDDLLAFYNQNGFIKVGRKNKLNIMIKLF